MEKNTILTVGILVAIGLILAFILLTPSLTGSAISNPKKTLDSYAWTKAICDKNNLCQDYLIECKGQETLKITPITGSLVKFDASWQDSRPIEQKERMCE